jgi:hypothetical protein
VPLFRRSKQQAQPPEHAVIVHLPLSGGDFGGEDERSAIYALEDRIIAAVEPIGGDHDGHEFGAGEAVLYTYGGDASALFDAIRPCLDDISLRPGAYAIKRFGPATDPNALQERVELG